MFVALVLPVQDFLRVSIHRSWKCLGVMFHCFMMYLCCLPALRDIFPTTMARYSLFVLKVPLNTKQTNKLRLGLSGGPVNITG